jgi:hypothetical protein
LVVVSFVSDFSVPVSAERLVVASVGARLYTSFRTVGCCFLRLLLYGTVGCCFVYFLSLLYGWLLLR